MNKELLLEMIDSGFVAKQKHPYRDLYIYNYTQFAQYEQVWNEVTLMCRGIILDSNYNIVERPLTKFFNMHELKEIPQLPFEIYDKLDGSLGILYWCDNIPHIASRGSFTSEQATFGTKILHNKYNHVWKNLDKSKTYVFEIIYNTNRIVVDYGDIEDIILIAIIDKETGKDCELVDVGFPIVEKIDSNLDFVQLQKLNLTNKEGFVIKFNNGFRMKIKFEEYVSLHRVLTNVSSYHIWDYLRNPDSNKNIELLLSNVPDEFHKWVKETMNSILDKYDSIYDEYEKLYVEHKHLNPKEFADWCKDIPNNSILFGMKNEKSQMVENYIWKMIKPKYEKAFNNK